MTTIPYININRINNVMRIFPNGDKQVSELYGVIAPESSVKNILPTLALLELIDYDYPNVTLSKIGLKYKAAILNDDQSEAAKILKPIIENNDLFGYIIEELNSSPKMTNYEIGKLIANKYNKSWEQEKTHSTYGSAIASIISYALGIRRSKGNLLSKTLGPPDVTYNSIIDILNILRQQEMSIDELNEKMKIQRASRYISVMRGLKLVELTENQSYKITDDGKQLVPILGKSEESVPEKWRNILFNSGYRNILSELRDEKVNTTIIGNLLNDFFDNDWNLITKKGYGKKFMTWLKNAKLAEDIGGNNYIINIGGHNLGRLKSNENNDEYDFFYLGLIAGRIMSEESSNYKDSEVYADIEFIMNFCKNDINLEDLYSLFDSQLQHYQNNKDVTIFIGPVKYLSTKIKKINQ